MMVGATSEVRPSTQGHDLKPSALNAKPSTPNPEHQTPNRHIQKSMMVGATSEEAALTIAKQGLDYM
jgi:hypothetical protein